MKKFYIILTYILLITFTISSCKKDKGYVKIHSISWYANNCQVPYIVQFDCDVETISGSISYTWDFGDGETSTEKNPVHIYRQTGVFKVTLTAKNKETTEIESKAVNLSTTDHNAIADFDYIGLNDNYMAPAEIEFYNYSNFSSNFFWNFGDNLGSNETNPIHIYNNPGTYNVTLKAFCESDTAVFNQQINIKPAPKDIIIKSIYIWLPSNLLYRDYQAIVKYSIHTEIASTISYYVQNFPIKWEINKEFFFFSGNFNDTKITFEIWDIQNTNEPVYSFDIKTIDLQNDYYPTLLTWNSGNEFKAEVEFDYE